MAAPHVAGVAALYLSFNSIPTAQGLFDKLTQTATPRAIKGDLKGSPNRLVFNGGARRKEGNTSPVVGAAEGGNVGIADSQAGDGKLFLDQQGAVHQKYGVAKHVAGTLIVVWPDGNLGYRVKGAGNAAWGDVDGYFRLILSA
ncbi:hypothetical protein BG006_003726 [Podila minutissima]|uniref:Peptidase S8/S53 domain-containing protein n=1 Tax=Podila minutissima TaxID=64525 RepID=A0A9P5SB07_9FUNG|nr:hypothetical protein BG006_003726 [Podila minutissima]